MALADGSPGIQKVSIKHEEIMNFMLANPTRKLQDVARHFGITPGWLSCVIHSEAFQARLAERKDAIFNETVLPLKEKMMVVAHQALDTLVERVPLMSDKDLNNLADQTLEKLGFGSKGSHAATQPGTPGTVNVTFNLRNELEEARSLIGARPSRPALEVLVDGKPAPIGIGSPAKVYAENLTDSGTPGSEEPVAGGEGPRAAFPAGPQV